MPHKLDGKKGFTLIELLVVIAIIALLLSVLIPSLKMAKEHAERLRCADHLKILGQVLHIYTDDYDDFLPEAYYREDYPTAARTYFMFTVFPDRPPSERVRDSYNMGPLWTTGYIDDGFIFYCPSNKRTAFSYEAYLGPEDWPSIDPEYTNSENPDSVRISYSYLPQSAKEKMTIGMVSFPNVAKRLSQTHPSRSMCLDVLQARQRMSHLRGGYAGANMLYSDASVMFRQNQDVLNEDDYDNDPMKDPRLWRSIVRALE